MVRYSRRIWLVACVLSAVAGFVDAIGFLQLSGFFVSFMSGNSTRAGVGLADFSGAAVTALVLIMIFVVGVIGGSLIDRWLGSVRGPLGLVAVALVIAALLANSPTAALWVVTFAMGVENTIFRRGDEVSFGLTYMTGNLVKFGQHVSVALCGGKRWAWLPYLLAWSSMIGGAALGAIGFRSFHANALWLPATLVSVLATLAWFKPKWIATAP